MYQLTISLESYKKVEKLPNTNRKELSQTNKRLGISAVRLKNLLKNQGFVDASNVLIEVVSSTPVCIVLEAILLPYSKPRGSRSRHFSLIHELFFTVENISIFLSTIILNTKSYIVLLDTGLKSPECCIEL